MKPRIIREFGMFWLLAVVVPLAVAAYAAYALWSASPEGVPFLHSELAGFESGGARYWMIHREFEFISPDAAARICSVER